MKTTMKLFAALMIMLGFAVTTFGQVNNATEHAYATVVSSINIDATQPLQFGNVLVGTANYKTIGADGFVKHGANPSTLFTEGEAQFTVTKAFNSSILLSLTLPSDLLALSDNTVKLPITYANTSAGDKLGAIGTVGFTPQSGTTLYQVSSTAYTTEYESNTFVVHVGGTVTASDTQLGDNYVGDLTLTATYN